MESLCGLERGYYVRRGPTPRRGSYKYWQIDSHVTPHPSCPPLCLLGPTLSKSHLHLSHRGCVLDYRGFTLRYGFFLSLVTPSFLPALPSSLCFYNPCWLRPRVVALLPSPRPPPTHTTPAFSRTLLSRSVILSFDSCGSWQTGRTVGTGGVKKYKVQGLN